MSRRSRELVTPLRIPRNEAAAKLAEDVKKRTIEEDRFEAEKDRRTQIRSQNAIRKTRREQSEAKITKEVNDIYALEREIRCEAAKSMRRTDLISRAYHGQSRYNTKQHLLNEMFIDDRRRPRYSQPRPLQIPLFTSRQPDGSHV
jgi:hypothetical protein